MRLASVLALVLGPAILAAGVAAQTPKPSALPDPSDSLPKDASPGCTTWLNNSLNQDADLEKCTQPLAQLVANYLAATKSKGRTAPGDSNALTTALNGLCQPNQGCQTGIIKQKLSDFATNCLDDMVAKNQDVIDLYDFLYLIIPFQQAICATDSSGQFCIQSLAASGAVSASNERRSLPGLDDERSQRVVRGLQGLAQKGRSLLSQKREPADLQAREPQPTRHQSRDQERERRHAELAKRQAASVPSGSVPVVSNASSTALGQDNLAFLFIKPNATQDILCGTCLQKILAGYISFETSAPYAIGLQNSDILYGQAALYKQAKTTCSGDWAGQVNSLAGTTAFAEVSGALSTALQGSSAFAATSVAALVVAGLALL